MNTLPINRTFRAAFAAAAITAITVVVLFALCGCQTVHKATVTLTSVVDVAMKDWARARADGLTTPDMDAKVMAAHDQYRQAVAAVIPIYESAVTSGDQPDAKAVLRTLRAAVDPLMELILPLVTEPQADNINTQLRKVNAP